MVKRRQLLRGEITYSTAKRKEVNILHRLTYPEKQNQFFAHIDDSHDWIKAVVAHHLNVHPSTCDVADSDSEWIYGSFNLCVPVAVRSWKTRDQPGRRVLLRLPLPYKVGEDFHPGNSDEKVRCEAGTYAWLQENCPEVPIPRLYGFALSSGETFTKLEFLPFLARCYHSLRRRLFLWIRKFAWFETAVLSQYIRHQIPKHTPQVKPLVTSGYLLMEYIEPEQGEMLSDSWPEKSKNTQLRTNFFRDLASIILNLARVSLPRVGSFTIDNHGFLSLTNRPLTLVIGELENEEIPTHIHRDYTYSTTDSYVIDTLGLHDSRLQNQPNAINDLSDGINQMTALTGMRTALPLFFQRDLRRGPFVFSLTDLHQSNIFVNKDWHITSLVDLEWACSLPIEMIHPPSWLTNKAIDTIDEDEYDKIRMEFMQILAAEEQKFIDYTRKPRLSTIMQRGWEIGTFWFALALRSPTGIFHVFDDRLQSRLGSEHYDDDDYSKVMMWHWAHDIRKIMNRKVADKRDYDDRLREAFDADLEE